MHSPSMPGICRCTLVNPMEKHLKKNQGMRVVLDMAEGLNGLNITCDIFCSHHTAYKVMETKGWNVTSGGL